MIKRVEDILSLASTSGRKYRMVVAGAESQSALETVDAAAKEGLVESILVGEPTKCQCLARELNIDLSRFEFHAASEPAEAMHTACKLVAEGQADFLFKGIVSTRVFLKGVLNKEFNLRGDRILSHVGVFNVPSQDRVMLITDAGVNVDPDLNTKMHILMNAVDLAQRMGNPKPRVAMLSFVEEATDPKIRSLAEATSITEMYRQGKITNCIVEGPYSLDVAMSPEAAKIKGVKGEVAGQADIIVMHDIGMGNVLYKALLLWCNPVLAAVVMGAKVPLIVTSRADSMKTKLNSIGLGILTIQHKGERA